jgi:hypothetical protein
MSHLLLTSSSSRLIATASRRTNSSNSLSFFVGLQQTLPFGSRQQQREDDNYRYNSMIIRNFSNDPHHPDRTMRQRVSDRAHEVSLRAQDYDYRNGAKRGAKIARKGAMTSYEKLKQYGPVFVGTYFTLYMATLGGLYAGVDSGLIDPVKLMGYISSGTDSTAMEESKTTAQLIIDYLQHYTLTRPAVPFLEKNPHFANLGVAWVATKFTEPVRLVVAMVVVPRLANYLGFIPPGLEDEELTTEEAEEAEEFVEDVLPGDGESTDESTTTADQAETATEEPKKKD